MQLTLSRSAVARPAATRKSAVVVRAEMRKNDLLRNFLPSEDNMPSGMQSNFTGRINHSRRANKSSPLNVRQSTPPTPRQQEVWTDSSARFYDDDASYGAYEGVAAAAAAGPLGYLFGALKRVMNHNFKGDETEPAAWSGSEGWTGDARPRDGRKKGSFHSRVL